MSIEYYSNDEELNATVLNRPISQLASEVAALKQQITEFVSNSRTITTSPYDINDSTPILPGCLVYIGDDGIARRALAVWDSYDANGVVMPSNTAFTAGIVVDTDDTIGTCSIMTRGSIPADITAGFASTLFNGVNSPYTGSWYLSQDVAGTVRRDGDDLYMKIPVVKVDALGNVYYTGAQPYSGYHIHKSFTIPSTATWTAGTNVWTYSGSAVADLDYFNWTNYTAAVDGAIVYNDLITLSEGDSGVVVTATADMTGKTVTIWVNLPDSHEQPVVRGIRTVGSGRLTASSENGLVTLGVDGWSGEEPAPIYRDRAIAQLTDNGGYTVTHVVSSLTGDDTIQLTQGSNGIWALSCANMTYIEPSITSLDNSTVTVSDGVLYYIFPALRASGVTGAYRLPAPPSGFHWVAHPFAQAALGSLTVTASLNWAARPEDNSSASAPAALTPSSITLTASAGTGRYLVVADTGWTLTAAGDAWLRLSADGTSAEDMNIISFGLKLEAVED